MEKRRAHHPLTKVKRLIKDERVAFTLTAVAGGAAMGFDTHEMLEVSVYTDEQEFLQKYDLACRPYCVA